MSVNNMMAMMAINALQSKKAEQEAAKTMEAIELMRPSVTETMLRDFNLLRQAIRAHDSFATEAAREKCERWVDKLEAKR